MNHYRFEFGINWNADNPQLQCGFVDLGSTPPTLTSPYHLQTNETLEFAVVDTTVPSEGLEISSVEINELLILFCPSDFTGSQSPIGTSSLQITAFESPATYDGPFYEVPNTPLTIYATATEDHRTLSVEGRFLFSAWVRASATSTALSTTIERIWTFDPEMVVGSGGGGAGDYGSK